MIVKMTVNGESGNHGEEGGGFLEGLPLPRFPYEGKQQFLNIYHREFDRFKQDSTGQVSQYLLFDIDEDTFNRDFLQTSDRFTPKLWGSFSSSEKLVLIKMGTPEHGNAAIAVHNEIIKAVLQMGLLEALIFFAGTEVQGDHRAKQPDQGYAPKRPPRTRSRKWPTVALEVAVSESHAKLKSDIEFWLQQSRGETEMVLTVRVDRRKPLITIDKWELQNGRPQNVEHITVEKQLNGHVIVQGDPLVIQFQRLFCRQPTVPRETDIILDQQKLKDIASTIWVAQGVED